MLCIAYIPTDFSSVGRVFAVGWSLAILTSKRIDIFHLERSVMRPTARFASRRQQSAIEFWT
ncbi:MAG: hypothetical protein QOE20_4768 [Mycobacterium sp.]|jgi:hypothetical protein|nr:hypothetical protein [Mycobacterium sp.]